MQPYLVDTCIWVDFFRPAEGEKQRKIRERLTGILVEDRVWIDGIILAEVLQGVKVNKEKKLINDLFGGVGFAEHTKGIYQLAGEKSAELRADGTTIPITDCVVAATALSYNLTIFTYDKHFEHFGQIEVEFAD